MGNLTRRKFVIQSSKLLAFIPFAGVIGCISDTNLKLDTEDSLKRLIFIVGPWTKEDRLTAENFVKRFLKSVHVKQYLPKSAKLIKTLAKQFSEENMNIKEVNLKELSEAERNLLVNLTKQLYSFVEIRFYVSKEPDWGNCQGNSNWHTQISK